jgi:hypothetical protein
MISYSVNSPISPHQSSNQSLVRQLILRNSSYSILVTLSCISSLPKLFSFSCTYLHNLPSLISPLINSSHSILYSSLKCYFRSNKYKHQISPLAFYISNDEQIHFFALSILFSFQNTLAIEQFKAAELGPHASIATEAFFFLVAIGYISIALPQR